MPITTLENLRDHLQWAIEVEHCTIPPYLSALYSIQPGKNREAREVILSVFLEEMLHMTLAANVLNAVGGHPQIDKPDFMPTYPLYLPHSSDAFMVPLSRFTPEALEVFLQIEKPEDTDAAPEEDRYDTLGQFYQAVEEGLKYLCAKHGEAAIFTGDPARQILPSSFDYDGGGKVIPVTDLASALAAIDEIEEQGEGLKHAEIWDGDRNIFHPDRDEVAHYFRYQEIKLGRSYLRGDTPQTGPTGERFTVDWSAVYPMRDNPRSSDYPEGSPIRAKMDEFNRTYSDLLRTIHAAFNGQPQKLTAALGGMYSVRNKAVELMQMPSGDGVTTAGPSFEYVPAPGAPAPQPVPSSAPAARSGPRITVQPNGPYLVEGGVRLVRKSIVYSEHGEPLTWRVDAVIPTGETYKLCRCGHSRHKPFCDDSHLRVGFDGTETADTGTRASRAHAFPGTRIVMEDDASLCADAGFCGNRIEKVWNLIERTEESLVRFQLMSMCERCPSGRLTYRIDGQIVEPDLPQEIAVYADGPIWVTGGIPVARSDGKPFETRNRMTLCRCGHSNNKPLCDSTHAEVDWKEAVNDPEEQPAPR